MTECRAVEQVAVQAHYWFLKHFARFLPPNTTVVGAMVYAGSAAPAARGRFYYDKGAEQPTGAGLAVLGAVQPNGTAVAMVMNAGGTAVSFRLKDGRMAGKSAPMMIPPRAFLI